MILFILCYHGNFYCLLEVWLYIDFIGCLCSSTLDPWPLSLALDPQPLSLVLKRGLFGPRPPKYCKNKFMNKAYYLFKIILIQINLLTHDIQKDAYSRYSKSYLKRPSYGVQNKCKSFLSQ